MHACETGASMYEPLIVTSGSHGCIIFTPTFAPHEKKRKCGHRSDTQYAYPALWLYSIHATLVRPLTFNFEVGGGTDSPWLWIWGGRKLISATVFPVPREKSFLGESVQTWTGRGFFAPFQDFSPSISPSLGYGVRFWL